MSTETTIALVRSGDELMEEAHRTAVGLLRDAKAMFGGRMPGESLYVKKGFVTDDHPDGLEFMWVEVQEWRGRKLRGWLANSPTRCRKPRIGDVVTVRESEIFDWTFYLATGKTIGGWTNRAAKVVDCTKEQTGYDRLQDVPREVLDAIAWVAQA